MISGWRFFGRCWMLYRVNFMSNPMILRARLDLWGMVRVLNQLFDGLPSLRLTCCMKQNDDWNTSEFSLGMALFSRDEILASGSVISILAECSQVSGQFLVILRGQQLVSYWFGARWFGFLASPYERGCFKPLIQTTNLPLKLEVHFK